MIRRIPHPLPQRRERERFGIPKGPKRVWLRHRKFVRSFECCVPSCQAPGEFHHIRSAANAGTGLLPFDWFGVPICHHHHMELHDCGVFTFEDRHGVDLPALAARLAQQSPDVQMRLAMAMGEGATAFEPSDEDLRQQVTRRRQIIDVIAGLPRFIPIYGRVR